MNTAINESKPIKIGDLVDRLGQLEKSAKSASGDKARNEHLREWVKVIITVPSAVAVAVGLIIQLYNFLEYKNKALELTLSKEILVLNEQLNKQDSKDMVRNAIFLLATMGPDAAPLLIYHIDDAKKEKPIIEAIGFGLKNIVEKNQKGDYLERERRITEVLNLKVEDAFNEQLHEKVSVPDFVILSNHINVLIKVYGAVKCKNSHRGSLNEYLKGAKEILLTKKEDFSKKAQLLALFDKSIKATSCAKT